MVFWGKWAERLSLLYASSRIWCWQAEPMLKQSRIVSILPFSRGHAPVFQDIATLLDAVKSDVLVDFSAADAAMHAIQVAAAKKKQMQLSVPPAFPQIV